MGKLFHKITAIALSALIAVPLVPAVSPAHASGLAASITPTEDTWTGSSTSYVTEVQGIQVEGAAANEYQNLWTLGTSASGDLSSERYASAMSYMKFNMADYTDVKIDSAKLKLYAHSNNAAVGGIKLYFFKIDNSWSEDSLTYSDAPITPIKGGAVAIDVTGTGKADRVQPDFVTPSFNLAAKDSGYTLCEFDITELTKKYNLKSDSDMSFAFIAYPSSYTMVIASKDNEDALVRPSLEITTSPIEPLEITSHTEGEIEYTDNIVAEFNNIIDSATVLDSVALYEDGTKVNLTQEDIIVNESVLTITKEKVPYCDYTVVISGSLADIYGGTLGTGCTFTVSAAAANTVDERRDILDSAHLNPTVPDNTRVTAGMFQMYAGGNYYPYYVELDMSDYIGVYLESASYNIKVNSGNAALKVYLYDVSSDFVPSTVTFATAPSYNATAFATASVGARHDFISIDITDYVRGKMQNLTEADPYIRFVLKSNAATTFLYSDLSSSENDRPYLRLEYADSTYVGINSTTPAKGEAAFGADDDIVVEFSAPIDSATEDNFVLTNLDTGAVVALDASQISCSNANTTVTIDLPAALDAYTPYELTITGFTSGHKNVRDKKISFITSGILDVGVVSLSGDAEADSAVSGFVDIVNSAGSAANTPVLITALYDRGKMVSYSADGLGESLSAGSDARLEASVSIPHSSASGSPYYAKSFLLTQADSYRPIGEVQVSGTELNEGSTKGKYFGEIALSGKLVGCSNAEVSLVVYDESGSVCHFDRTVSDADGSYCFYVAFDESGKYTAYVNSNVHFGARVALDAIDYTSHADYLSLWTDINSADKTRILNVLDDVIDKFGYDKIDFDITPFADEVADSVKNHGSFGAFSNANIASLGTFLTSECVRLQKLNSIFEIVKNAKNQSVLTAVFTNSENASLLGITSYLTEYNKNTAKVNNALVGKSFDSLSDFQTKFTSALNAEDPPVSKPSAIGGGGKYVAVGVTTTPATNDSTLMQREENYFTDLQSASWAEKEIEFLYRMGVINGRGERLYAPGDNVLREEFVKLILEASELSVGNYDVNFSDVSKDAWYRDYVASALHHKLINGVSDTLFGSGLPITRQDICVMTLRALSAMGYPTVVEKGTNFTDSASISDYAKDAVAYLSYHGVINGNPDGSFYPHNTATRAETACIIYRTLEHITNYASTIWKDDTSTGSSSSGSSSSGSSSSGSSSSGSSSSGTGSSGATVFSTPTQAQIKSDIETVLAAKSHPYLYADAEKLEEIKQSVLAGDDEYISKKYAQVKARADQLLTSNPTVLNAVSQGCISVRKNVLELMTTYHVEGDEKYLNRALVEFRALETVTNWDSGAQLDNTMTAEAIAFCYDWLYDHLTAEQRAWVEKTVKEKALSIAYEYYKNPSALSSLRAAHANMNIVISRGTFNHTIYNNSNLIVAALALAKTDPDYSSFIIANALYNIEPYWELVKDGGFEEPATYYHYCTGRAGIAMASLQSALGTMYGYEKTQGFKNTAWFGLYMYGPMTFGDASAAKSSYDTDSLYFYAKHARNASMIKRIIELDKGSAIDALLCYDKGEHNNISPGLTIPLDRLFSVPDQSTAVFRNHGDDNTNIFTGLYAGKGTATGHSDPVSGLFCLDAFGERFITALGAGDYNLPGYWDNAQGGGRWDYYERRTEGGNCLVINPGLDVGQDVSIAATITRQESSDGCAYAVTDLKEVYHENVNSYERGLKLHMGRTAIVVQDEAVMKKPSEIFWSFNTPADIEVIDNETALLSIGNKKVAVKVYANVPYELYEMKAESLPTSPKPSGQKVFREYRKLAIKASNVTELKLMVELTPIVSMLQMPETISPWIDLADWIATERSKPVPEADAVYINGEKAEGIGGKSFFYEYTLSADESMPEITVDTQDGIFAEVMYPDALPGNADIAVCDADGNLSYYTIGLKKEAKPIDVSGLTKLSVVKVTASDDDGNLPENAIDGSLASRWSASGENGDATLDLDLGSEQNLKAVGIAFYSGTKRKSYFEIHTSNDGKNWTRQIELGESSGKSNDFEYFALDDVKARYVRYVGQQNSLNHWNSICEISVYAE